MELSSFDDPPNYYTAILKYLLLTSVARSWSWVLGLERARNAFVSRHRKIRVDQRKTSLSSY
jgi:hypothetical protein